VDNQKKNKAPKDLANVKHKTDENEPEWIDKGIDLPQKKRPSQQ